eukprot:3318565-Rhodomonas_salina.2
MQFSVEGTKGRILPRIAYHSPPRLCTARPRRSSALSTAQPAGGPSPSPPSHVLSKRISLSCLKQSRPGSIFKS